MCVGSSLLSLFLSGSALAQDPARLRALLEATPPGTEVEATLRSGERVRGPLAEVGADAFSLWVEADPETRRRHGSEVQSVKRSIRYEDVNDVAGVDTGVATTLEALAFRLRVGDEVQVRTTSGEIVKGKIEDLDREAMRLRGRSLGIASEVERIDVRESDSVRNGALIGFGIGAGIVALACATPESGCTAPLVAVGITFYGGAGAGLGALFDSMKKSTRTVYVAPLVSGDRKGMLVSIRF
jgi:small nuclear ribonucleoprotein (snRNP)-like protein